MMAKLTRDQLQRGVLCSSAGNHAHAEIGMCVAVIAMPVSTPEIKSICFLQVNVIMNYIEHYFPLIVLI